MKSDIQTIEKIISSVRERSRDVHELQRLSVILSKEIMEKSCAFQTSFENHFSETCQHLSNSQGSRNYILGLYDRIFTIYDSEKAVESIFAFLDTHGYLKFLGRVNIFLLKIFRKLPKSLAQIFLPFIKNALIRKIEDFLIDRDPESLTDRLLEVAKDQMGVIVYPLNGTCFSEEDQVDYISEVISHLKNPLVLQVQVSAEKLTLPFCPLKKEILQRQMIKNLRKIISAAQKFQGLHADGVKRPKKVFLSFETYDYFELSVSVFKSLCEENEFWNYSFGFCLPSYFPESITVCTDIIALAKSRIRGGGAPIYLQIFKGGGLSEELVAASIENKPLATFATKLEVDASFKKIIQMTFERENIVACHVNIASYNIFDLSYCLLLAAQNGVETYVKFVFYAKIFESFASFFQQITPFVSLVFPLFDQENLSSSVPYLYRLSNFLLHPNSCIQVFFESNTGQSVWSMQEKEFVDSFSAIETLSSLKKREVDQNTIDLALGHVNSRPARLDFSLGNELNQIKQFVKFWPELEIPKIPLSIGHNTLLEGELGVKMVFTKHEKKQVQYCKANIHHAEMALEFAESFFSTNCQKKCQDRILLIESFLKNFQELRFEFLGVMQMDVGMNIQDADREFTLCIGTIEKAIKSLQDLQKISSMTFSSKGIFLVLSNWNMPLASPLNAIVHALVSGGVVILKPDSKALLVAYKLCECFWKSGVDRMSLQFLPHEEESVTFSLISSPKIHVIYCALDVAFAHRIYKTRPDVYLIGDLLGKNCAIISSSCDEDRAIDILLKSAFTFSGQSPYAVNLAIIESELYDNPKFLQKLKAAVGAIKNIGVFDLEADLSPLESPPKGSVKRSLMKLDFGEKWLLQPHQNGPNSGDWTPGIKLDVRPYGFSHMQEYLGPVLSLMRADDLDHAIAISNIIYHKSSLLFCSLDEYEHKKVIQESMFSSIFINRPIKLFEATLQPYGLSQLNAAAPQFKISGPNFILQFLNLEQRGLPRRKGAISERVGALTALLDEFDIQEEKLALWAASISNYAFAWSQMKHPLESLKILGQQNILIYRPLEKMCFRIEEDADILDCMLICAASLTCLAEMEISVSNDVKEMFPFLIPSMVVVKESLDDFLRRIEKAKFSKIRVAGTPNFRLYKVCHEHYIPIASDLPVSTGRIELLHYVREVCLSYDYHRYGNLGTRVF